MAPILLWNQTTCCELLLSDLLFLTPLKGSWS